MPSEIPLVHQFLSSVLCNEYKLESAICPLFNDDVSTLLSILKILTLIPLKSLAITIIIIRHFICVPTWHTSQRYQKDQKREEAQKRTLNNCFCASFLASPNKKSDQAGIRTQDPQLRRLLLYPAELPDPDYCHFVQI